MKLRLVAPFCFVLLVAEPSWSLNTILEFNTLYIQYPLVDHPAHSYLSRLETAGILPLLSGTRPYLGHGRHPVQLQPDVPDRELSRYVQEGIARNSLTRARPPTEARGGWRPFKQRLPFGLSRATWFYPDGYHLARWWYDSTFSAAIQPLYGLEVINTDDERGSLTRFAGGLRVEGGYRERLHYLVDFRDYTEAGNGPYWERSSLFEDRWASVELSGGSSTSYDISESFLQYTGRDLSVTLGRGRNSWGPAQFGSLFLNSAMPPYDYIRMDAVLENAQRRHAVYYTFLHGNLESRVFMEPQYVNPDGRSRALNAQKYLSAQRLEVRPRGNLLFGFSQGVVYGDRGAQLGYATPVNFLYSLQHSNDDKDNMMLAVDGKWRPLNGALLYAEALFDDIAVSELTTSHGSNKSAYTLGTRLAGTGGAWRHFTVTSEYTRVRPFVYTHVFDVNVYTHWTSPLGYTREPNSEFITYELRTVFYPVQIALNFSRQNHGANVMLGDSLVRNVGGDIHAPLRDQDKANTFHLLEGRFERKTCASLFADLEVLPNFTLRARGTIVKDSGRDRRIETEVGFGWNL